MTPGAAPDALTRALDDARDRLENDSDVYACADALEALVDAVDARLAAEPVPELAGFAEAAEILGVATGNLQKVAGLPEPVQALRSGSIWRAADLRALARKRRRRRRSS